MCVRHDRHFVWELAAMAKSGACVGDQVMVHEWLEWTEGFFGVFNVGTNAVTLVRARDYDGCNCVGSCLCRTEVSPLVPVLSVSDGRNMDEDVLVKSVHANVAGGTRKGDAEDANKGLPLVHGHDDMGGGRRVSGGAECYGVPLALEFVAEED